MNLLILTLFFSFTLYAGENNKSPQTCASCGTVPYPTNYPTPDPIISGPDVWSFVSEPNLHPMKVTVYINTPAAAPGLIFTAPYAFSSDAIVGQPGSLIMDSEGNPIWFRPLNSPNLMNTDFRVQIFKNEPVLTFWQGTLVTPPAYTNAPGGSSEPGSCYYILDNSYQTIKTIEAQRGYISDIHEFLITPNDSALFLSTKKIPMDLRPYGGPQNGFIQNFAIQEIDLNTNELIFFWNALEHIPLSDSYEPASSATSSGNVWDVYHLNSLGLTDNKNEIIVSGRNTWTIYKINKLNNKIIWRLGGKQSDFTIESNASFSWQHDARFLSPTTVSLFDDNCCESSTIPPGTPPSRGLVLELNLAKKTASMKRNYFHNPNLQIGSQGNVQNLSNGNKFIGWGESQYFSEYKNAGNTVNNPALNTVYDAKMPGNNYTYRAYRDKWVGLPCDPPSIAVRLINGEIKVYASWNGSTETAAWQVCAGTNPHDLSSITEAKKSGFETAISVSDPGPYFMVSALDANGEILGESRIVKLE